MIDRLSHYRIDRLLGEGTFAHVYRAFDQKLERPVALKVLKPFWLSDPQAISRFITEAKTMARLHHPNIVAVYDVDQIEGQVYMAQFLVEGETLAARIARQPIPWPQTLALLKDIAAALDAAHAQGVVHRDVKPQNILLDANHQPYLSDFGLVRAAEGSASISASVSLVGTGHYIAPEVWDNQPATPATDVYALSCIIYEMLTGNILFEGSSIMTVVKKHADGPQLPNSWPPGVPSGLTAVLQKGLAKNPANRFAGAGTLVATLNPLDSGEATTSAQTRSQTSPSSGQGRGRAVGPPTPAKTRSQVSPPATDVRSPAPTTLGSTLVAVLRSALYGGISFSLLYYGLALIIDLPGMSTDSDYVVTWIVFGIPAVLGGAAAGSKTPASLGGKIIWGAVWITISLIIILLFISVGISLMGGAFAIIQLIAIAVVSTVGLIISWAWVKLLNWLFHRSGVG